MVKKVVTFIFSGGAAAATKLVLFIILFSFLSMWYLLASVLAFLCSIVVGFYMQKYVTFKNFSKDGVKKQAIIFVGVSLLNLLVNVILMYSLVQIFRCNEIIAQIVTIGIIACWNFFVYERFVFGVGQDIL